MVPASQSGGLTEVVMGQVDEAGSLASLDSTEAANEIGPRCLGVLRIPFAGPTS